jgi:hypothetical protein
VVHNFRKVNFDALRGNLHGQLVPDKLYEVFPLYRILCSVFCSVFDFVCYVVLVAEERRTRFTEADFVVFNPIANDVTLALPITP